jgi:ABC-type uncharacterized transport system permease subunit
MIFILAFIRTISVALICVLASSVVYYLILYLCYQFGLQPTADGKRWTGIVCLLAAWISYRLFFWQVWQKEGDEWIQE